VGKCVKCLYFLSIFIAQNLTIGLIIWYISLNILEQIIIIIIVIHKPNKHLNRYSNTGQFLGLWSWYPWSLHWNKHFCSLCSSFIVLSFWATETALIGTWTPGNFSWVMTFLQSHAGLRE
jgi:hypothetical protein